jgi:hypothetical protein
MLWTDIKGILGKAYVRGWEQPEGTFAARSSSCSSDNVHECNVNLAVTESAC